MENTELLTAWAELQNRVEIANTFAVKRASASEMLRLRARIARSPISDLVISSLAILVIGNFVADNFGVLAAAPVAVIPATILFLFAIGIINVSIRQLILGSTLDYATPVVEAQKSLAALRKLRVRSTQWIFSAALPLWVLFPILLGQMVVNVKFIFALSPAWILCNIAFGLAMLPVVNYVLRKSRYSQSLLDSIAGKNIAEAEALLQELEEFQAA